MELIICLGEIIFTLPGITYNSSFRLNGEDLAKQNTVFMYGRLTSELTVLRVFLRGNNSVAVRSILFRFLTIRETNCRSSDIHSNSDRVR